MESLTFGTAWFGVGLVAIVFLGMLFILYKMIAMNDGNQQQPKEKRGRGTWKVRLIVIAILLLAAAVMGGLVYGYQIHVAGKADATGILISLIALILLGSIVILRSYVVIPEKWNWVVEVWGQYDTVWKPGFNFLFPFLNFMDVHKVYTGGQDLVLFEKADKTATDGVIDFSDGSAAVTAHLIFSFADAEKAVYAVDDIYGMLRTIVGAAVRSYLAAYAMETANTLKIHFNAARIFHQEFADKEGKFPAPKTLEEADLYKTALEKWGVRIEIITVSDIDMPEDVIKEREKLLIAGTAIDTANKEKELAEVEKETALIRAETKKEVRIKEAQGEKEALALEGKGLAEQLAKLKEAGLEAIQAGKFITERLKWENLGDKTVIIDGAGAASFGAQFGVGMKAASKTGSSKPAPKAGQPQPPAKPQGGAGKK